MDPDEIVDLLAPGLQVTLDSHHRSEKKQSESDVNRASDRTSD